MDDVSTTLFYCSIPYLREYVGNVPIPQYSRHWLPSQHTITALNQRLYYRTFRILNIATNIFITSAAIWTRNYRDNNNDTYMLNIFNALTNCVITTRLRKELLWLKISVIWYLIEDNSLLAFLFDVNKLW